MKICGCNNNLSTANETNIVIIIYYYLYLLITQYCRNVKGNIIKRQDIIQCQYNDNKFIKNWSIRNFNDLSLIQRITIIHQVNRIIKAFRTHNTKKSVRNNLKIIF